MDSECVMPFEHLSKLLFDKLTRNYTGRGNGQRNVFLFFLKAALLKPPHVISSFSQNVTLVFTADKRR